ncbi:MAG: hypothetical protein JNK84_09390 [Phreatobacter sp.]|uniref:hypothetical protein n=1 Tax=Phreatobacter sp. TaxID=1966341 RepID=UPI001A56661E|nr:hypothetical protein [Phreatobacter sp.]MBL8569288.1 hypothetical protein [Phreatobacter sp.]
MLDRIERNRLQRGLRRFVRPLKAVAAYPQRRDASLSQSETAEMPTPTAKITGDSNNAWLMPVA